MRKTALGVALLLAGATWTAGASAQAVSTSLLIGNCVACHGMDGVSRGPVTPSIGGLSKPYFINAMLAYKYGKDSAKIEAAAKALKLSPDDIDGLPRLATVMDRLAKGYSDEDIGRMADYFAGKPFVAARQKTDVVMAARGKQLHEDSCEKCHENGGRKADEAGRLAGQWMPYLANAVTDFNGGHREMPKKMRAKMQELKDLDFEALVHFYGSQK